jgi:hypothetical protein
MSSLIPVLCNMPRAQKDTLGCEDSTRVEHCANQVTNILLLYTGFLRVPYFFPVQELLPCHGAYYIPLAFYILTFTISLQKAFELLYVDLKISGKITLI